MDAPLSASYNMEYIVLGCCCTWKEKALKNSCLLHFVYFSSVRGVVERTMAEDRDDHAALREFADSYEFLLCQALPHIQTQQNAKQRQAKPHRIPESVILYRNTDGKIQNENTYRGKYNFPSPTSNGTLNTGDVFQNQFSDKVKHSLMKEDNVHSTENGRGRGKVRKPFPAPLSRSSRSPKSPASPTTLSPHSPVHWSMSPRTSPSLSNG